MYWCTLIKYLCNYLCQMVKTIDVNIDLLFSIFLIITIILTLFALYKGRHELNHKIIINYDLVVNERRAEQFKSIEKKFTRWSLGVVCYSLLFLVGLDCYYDLGLAGWISGIGSFSAIGIYLFKDYLPSYVLYLGQYEGDCNKAKYTIQAINYSKQSDCIELSNIFLFNKERNKVKPEKIPCSLQKYETFQPIKNKPLPLVVFKNKSSKIYQDLMKNNEYNYLACTFIQLSNHKHKTAKISKEDIRNITKEDKLYNDTK